MTVRVPVVIVTGQLQQLQSGDSIASSGSVAEGEVELDFGTVPGKDMVSASVARTQITATSATRIAAFVSPKTTADKSIDEHIIDSIEAYAHSPVAGVGFTVTARSTAGLLLGKYNIGWISVE